MYQKLEATIPHLLLRFARPLVVMGLCLCPRRAFWTRKNVLLSVVVQLGGWCESEIRHTWVRGEMPSGHSPCLAQSPVPSTFGHRRLDGRPPIQSIHPTLAPPLHETCSSRRILGRGRSNRRPPIPSIRGIRRRLPSFIQLQLTPRSWVSHARLESSRFSSLTRPSSSSKSS